jgi:proline iminopeptidase
LGVVFPAIEPYAHGMLDVSDGNLIYWEACGNPDGKPALVVHGGPGSGCIPGTRQLFDPARYRIILFDQRGCGRSRPHASDPCVDITCNTTWHLVRDMECLREHLGVKRWLLSGVSWGVTLALAYAEAHPERVSAMVLWSVTTTRRSEIAWLYGGVSRFFPEAHERFRAGAGIVDGDSVDVVAAYARLMETPDRSIRERAAAEWCAWEDAVISLEHNGSPGAYSARADDARLAFVRICTQYFAHAAWLDEGMLIRNAGRLAGIPGVLIHGRGDLGGPVATAWELARAWPGAELIVIEDSGHTGSDVMEQAKITALDRFAAVR